MEKMFSVQFRTVIVFDMEAAFMSNMIQDKPFSGGLNFAEVYTRERQRIIIFQSKLQTKRQGHNLIYMLIDASMDKLLGGDTLHRGPFLHINGRFRLRKLITLVG